MILELDELIKSDVDLHAEFGEYAEITLQKLTSAIFAPSARENDEFNHAELGEYAEDNII